MHEKIENNASLGPREKKETQEIYDSLKQFFSELKSKNELKKHLGKNEKRGKAYIKIVESSIKRAEVFNSLMNIVDKDKKREKFDELNKIIDPGNKNIVANMWFQLALSNYVTECEYFRVTMFQVIKQKTEISNGKTTLKDFIIYLEKISNKVKPITKLIDIQLRNSISHGLVWFDDKKVCIAHDANFNKTEETDLYGLWKKAKFVNIVNQMLLIVISETFET